MSSKRGFKPLRNSVLRAFSGFGYVDARQVLVGMFWWPFYRFSRCMWGSWWSFGGLACRVFGALVRFEVFGFGLEGLGILWYFEIIPPMRSLV